MASNSTAPDIPEQILEERREMLAEELDREIDKKTFYDTVRFAIENTFRNDGQAPSPYGMELEYNSMSSEVLPSVYALLKEYNPDGLTFLQSIRAPLLARFENNKQFIETSKNRGVIEKTLYEELEFEKFHSIGIGRDTIVIQPAKTNLAVRLSAKERRQWRLPEILQQLDTRELRQEPNGLDCYIETLPLGKAPIAFAELEVLQRRMQARGLGWSDHYERNCVSLPNGTTYIIDGLIYRYTSKDIQKYDELKPKIEKSLPHSALWRNSRFAVSQLLHKSNPFTNWSFSKQTEHVEAKYKPGSVWWEQVREKRLLNA